ncbi:MAG: septum site-determining protein Ssd [Candidatus Nanopelagicales bacterium]
MAATTLLVTEDPLLTETVRRVAAVAARELEVVADPHDARGSWMRADDVLVGDDAVHGCLDAGLRRRPRVAVVTGGRDAELPWRAVLALGAEAVVPLPAGEGQLLERLAVASQQGGGLVVGVTSGSGGAGASVLAAALCLAGVRARLSPLLLDTDPDGPGADLLLGAEDAAGARWRDLSDVTSGLDPASLRAALPSAHGVHVLAVDRGEGEPLPVQALEPVLASARHAFDLVVLDLPRGRPRVLERLVPSCDDVLLVATGDVRGATAAARVAARLRGAAPVRLVSRAVPGGGLDGPALAEWLGLPSAADLAHDPRLVAALDRGEPPGAGGRLAKLVDQILSRTLAGQAAA